MKARSVACIVLTIFLASCANTKVKNSSDYSSQLLYPKETKSLLFEKLFIYDEPLFGASLSYHDPAYPSDTITVYIYPIRATEWQETDEVLHGEMDAVYAEVQHSYQQVSEETRGKFFFDNAGKNFEGLKSRFDFEHQGRQINSFAYLFLSKDKYIKFRTSFDAQYTPDWNGDQIVQEILPGITVPDESLYMKSLRDEQREIDRQRREELMRLLLKAVENGDLVIEEEGEESTPESLGTTE